MASTALCPGCQRGNHSGHIQEWHPAESCPFGGLECVCGGDCQSGGRVVSDDLIEDVEEERM